MGEQLEVAPAQGRGGTATLVAGHEARHDVSVEGRWTVSGMLDPASRVLASHGERHAPLVLLTGCLALVNAAGDEGADVTAPRINVIPQAAPVEGAPGALGSGERDLGDGVVPQPVGELPLGNTRVTRSR